MDEATALLEKEPAAGPFVVYRRRFWVLFVFCAISFNQNVIWLTYSPISDMAQQYYGISSSDTDLLLNLGAIVYIPVVPLTTWLTTRRGGLRSVVLLGAWLTGLATAFRILPTVWPESFFPGGWQAEGGRKGDGEGVAKLAMACVYIGQTLNAAAGPIVMASVTKLSAAWFPVHERTTATAVGVLSNNLGASAGFLMMPGIVKSFVDVTTLLNLHAGLAILTLMMCLAYLPDAPPTPPSPSAMAEESASAKPQFKRDIILASCNWSFVALALANGLASGVFNAWTGVLSTLLAPKFSDSDAGWFGFATTVGMIVGGLAIGPLADRVQWVHDRFKLAIVVILAVDLAFFVWFTMSFPFAGRDGLLPQSFWPVAIAITGGGLFLGASYPLFYELAVEVTFPVSETVSAAFLTLVTNASTLVFLFIANSVPNYVLNTTMAGSVAAALALVLVSRETYNRREMESVKRPQLQP